MENWLPIRGWEGVYEVSSLGRIRRIAGGRGTRAGTLLSPIKHCLGYEVVRLRFNGMKALPLVHTVVAEAFIGPRPAKHEINHINGNRRDNRVDNLEYTTSSGNKLHAYRDLKRSKVSCPGERNGRAKLTSDQVDEIRRRYELGGVSQQALADEFGMSQPVISQIVRRAIWVTCPTS